MTPSAFLGSNISQVKEHNLRAILRCFLYDGPLSRIQLAKKMALSATTITNLVDELVGTGILNECEETLPLEQRGVGRPQSRLCLSSRTRYAVGVHMRVGVFRVALVDLLGQVVDCTEVEFDSSSAARKVIGQIAD